MTGSIVAISGHARTGYGKTRVARAVVGGYPHVPKASRRWLFTSNQERALLKTARVALSSLESNQN